MSPVPIEISVLDLKAALDAGEPVRLVDVREPEEFAICSIAGARLIPMRTVPLNVAELDSDEGGRLVVYCHHGVRSLSVADFLRRQGVDDCQSLAGGIDEWSRVADPAVPRY